MPKHYSVHYSTHHVMVKAVAFESRSTHEVTSIFRVPLQLGVHLERMSLRLEDILFAYVLSELLGRNFNNDVLSRIVTARLNLKTSGPPCSLPANATGFLVQISGVFLPRHVRDADSEQSRILRGRKSLTSPWHLVPCVLLPSWRRRWDHTL